MVIDEALPVVNKFEVFEHRLQKVVVELAVSKGALIETLSVLQVNVLLKDARIVKDALAEVALPTQHALVCRLQVRPKVLSG